MSPRNIPLSLIFNAHIYPASPTSGHNPHKKPSWLPVQHIQKYKQLLEYYDERSNTPIMRDKRPWDELFMADGSLHPRSYVFYLNAVVTEFKGLQEQQ